MAQPIQSHVEHSQSEEAVVTCPSPHMSFPTQNTTSDRLISFLNAATVIDFVMGLTGLRVLYKQNQSNLDS